MLVEELASIVWRKRRVLTAEAASLNDGLERTINFPKRLINTSWPFHLHINDSGDDGGEIERELRSLLALDEDGLREHKKHLAEMRESLKAAGERLAQGGKGAARQAFGLLAEDLQDLWYATSRCSNTKEDIENFILNEVSQKVDNAEEITNCVTEIRQQAAGSSFHGFPFEQIARYEPKSSAIEPRKPSWLWLIKCRAASGTVGRASRTRCSSASFPAASSRRSSSRSQTTRGLESGTWPQAIS